jgi:Zn-dependent protease/CBS domain-containing protein
MFGKRLNVLSIGGFKIGVDISWFFIAILLSWSLAAGYFPAAYPKLSTAAYWLMGISGMIGLFICIVLHELGHAIVAKHYGLPITYITLFIFGGVAELKKEPTTPKVEFWMAIAGPIVSFVLALIFFLVTRAGTAYGWPLYVRGVTGYLAIINFLLAIFNLIPAFPLDGGRVFRSILWAWKKNLGWATRVSALIGSAFGFTLIFLGILAFFTRNFLAGFWLLILGWFLHRAASSVQSQYFIGKELEGEKVAKFMKQPISVTPNLSVQEFVDRYVYISHHHLYPVTEDGKLVGYISLQEAKSLAPLDWSKTQVGQVMAHTSSKQIVTPDTSALAALDLFQQTHLPTLFVVENEHLVGILTTQDLFKLISLKVELEGGGRGS